MEIEKLDIDNFWTWFSDNYNDFGKYFDNEKLLNDLDNRINELGDFTWEVGPGTISENQLVISPGGDINLLPFTKEIISYAKPLPDWEFHYAKPPKQWELQFEFETENGELIEIQASGWKYVLLKYEDGMFEIILQAPELENLNETDKLTAAEILLDGILGEEKRLLTICYIEVVTEVEQQYRNKSSEITNLSSYFKR